MPVERVLLAAPRGFCAGVEKAIKALAWMVRVFEPPVYCYHEIVHNRYVVEQFRRQGVIFVDDVNEVPAGAPLMLSAHGSAPEVIETARTDGRVVVDAVCPLVTKVHHELRVRASKGYTILYVGHQGHEEAVGTMAVAPDSVKLVTSEEDVDRAADELGAEAAVALLAQTTLSHDEWSGIMTHSLERFPNLWMPNRSDLCFATTNRQTALKAIAGRSDAVVVIGSINSSNTRALEKVARAVGCSEVYRVNEASELPLDLSGTVGVTAGASAPDELVDAVVERLDPLHGVEEVHVTVEDEYFPPPPELRELLKGLCAALSFGLCASSSSPVPPAMTPVPPATSTEGSGSSPDDTGGPLLSPLAGDRKVSAADVLAEMAG
ncbi:MAG TPA: 4-hydroxy-3-methylbut-2-enyl diphosphate reductase [Acidimicrobiales bacterium]|nr:4-hydroxy-3-methylbut-2-enyl diphosphate reductase [Acidimicrobiales bacterium]